MDWKELAVHAKAYHCYRILHLHITDQPSPETTFVAHAVLFIQAVSQCVSLKGCVSVHRVCSKEWQNRGKVKGGEEGEENEGEGREQKVRYERRGGDEIERRRGFMRDVPLDCPSHSSFPVTVSHLLCFVSFLLFSFLLFSKLSFCASPFSIPFLYSLLLNKVLHCYTLWLLRSRR